MALTDPISATRNFAANARQLSGIVQSELLERISKARAKVSTAQIYLAALRQTLADERPAVEVKPRVVNETPTHWDKRTVLLAGYEANVTTISGISDNRTAIFLLGHDNEAEYYVPLIERLEKRDSNIIIVELPSMSDSTHQIDGVSIEEVYQKFVSAAVLESQSPVLSAIPPGHTLKIVTHSGSAQGFERTIRMDPKKADYALEHYDGNIIHTGIILETTESSIFYNPIKSLSYLWYSARNKVTDKKVGTTYVDRAWMNGDEDVYNDEICNDVDRNVTHGQARRLKIAGIKHIITSFAKSLPFLRASNPSFFKLKRTIYMGEQETCSCTKTAALYGKIVDGVTTETFANGRHSLLMECAKVYRKVAKALSEPPQPSH